MEGDSTRTIPSLGWVWQLQKADEMLTAWDIAVLPDLILIVLGTHEIGHVLSGLSQGMRFLLLIAGGPAASLLLAIVAIAMASVSDPRFAAYGIFIAATSFGIFLVTLIPVRAGGFMSDGLQFIDELKGVARLSNGARSCRFSRKVWTAFVLVTGMLLRLRGWQR